MIQTVENIGEKLVSMLTYDASQPLIFSSGLFLFLFAGFMLIYNAFRRAPMARIVYVILFSLYFYYKSSGLYFLLLILAATSDYWIARGIHRVRNRAGRRWLVALSVAVNLGMLGYFKYTKRKYGEGRRILLMSPLHHHYQKQGFFETKIVTRFWIVSLLLAAITLVTLKIR